MNRQIHTDYPPLDVNFDEASNAMADDTFESPEWEASAWNRERLIRPFQALGDPARRDTEMQFNAFACSFWNLFPASLRNGEVPDDAIE